MNRIEKLMVEIIHYLSDAFPNQAILKGGMELRLLDCPRYTNDLDYVFIPFESKKDVVELLIKSLSQFPDAIVKSSIHSTCVRFFIEKENTMVQLEVNVAMACKSESLSTSSLAVSNGFLPRIIRGMSFPVALSHKLAAWNERGLIRDLYDVSFMVNVLGVRPDLEVIKSRLKKVQYRQKMKLQKKQMTINDFITRLNFASENLTYATVEKELRDTLSLEELPGLEKKIKIAIAKIVDELQGMNNLIF